MPHLTIRGIDSERVIAVSEALVRQLANICLCDTDNFTFNCLETISAMDGKQVETYPFIEVAWFERGTQIRDLLAETITRHFMTAGVQEIEIAFKVYSPEGYYINGVRYDTL